MPLEIKSSQVLLCVNWGDSKVYLLRDDFYGHIKNHSEVNEGKIGLVESVVGSALNKNEIYQWFTSPISDFFVQLKCVDFLPMNDYLRVSFRKLDDKVFKITSAYPVFGPPTKGVRNYDPGI